MKLLTEIMTISALLRPPLEGSIYPRLVKVWGFKFLVEGGEVGQAEMLIGYCRERSRTPITLGQSPLPSLGLVIIVPYSRQFV